MTATEVKYRVLKEGVEIRSLEDWVRLAPPRSLNQWVDGRSAKETAKAWLGGLPAQVAATLNSNPEIADFRALIAEPEHETYFDAYSPGRVHDVVVVGTAGYRSVLLGVEGKADETFGGKYASAAVRSAPVGSAIPERVENLRRALFGGQIIDLEVVRYQLLYAVAGTVVEASERNCGDGVFLVHEFVTEKTKDRNHDLNAKDLDIFVKFLSNGEHDKIRSGDALGPFRIPGGGRIPAWDRLFVAKVTTEQRHGS